MPSFSFRWYGTLVDNRQYDFSKVRRMSNALTAEISIPFTDHHLLTEVTCSLFPWHAKPDAWEITTDGWPFPEKVFPYAEWVPCPECGKDIINDQIDEHIETHHEGETRRFPPYGNTKDEYQNAPVR